MALKDLYESWAFKPLAGVGAADTPIKQSEGNVAVNFLQDTYQPRKEVKVNRTPGDKVVTQATADDATVGLFKPEAFEYYSTLFASPLKTFKSKLVHKYNAQGTSPADKYETANPNAPGTLYSTNK
jgi:hypothetical protein